MRKQGFTLIELLVVIAIIAILAAILFPLMANAKERGRQSRCCYNLKQLTMAIRQYCDDNNGAMPSCLGSASNPRLDWAGCLVCGQPFSVSTGQLWPFVKTKGVFLCPSDVNYKQKNGQPKIAPELSYSMNYQMGCVYGAPATDYRRLLKLDVESAGRASKILLLIHEAPDRLNDGYFAWGNDWDIPTKVHSNDGSTVAYVDGHCKWAGYKQLIAEMQSGNWMSNTMYGKR